MGPSRVQLQKYEHVLRRDDKALRLRFSIEKSDTILVERKTFRGRIGTIAPEGLSWAPDAGYRREQGHVPVASFPASAFDFPSLQKALRSADTWKRDRPIWRDVEERESREMAHKKANRTLGLRYKASELFDRFAWKHKMRIAT